MIDGSDEFEQIRRLYHPLTEGSPEALDLMDDAAVVPSRPGFDLVLTKDAMVEGVHFLAGEGLDLVARKLLRVNLSDLAAKAAQPHGYLLAIAWPVGTPFERKACFAAGLAEDQRTFGVRLLGGDTVSTSGPLVASLTLLGWTPAGGLVRRGGGRSGDVVLVSGVIGDAGLGLCALRERLPTLSAQERVPLIARLRLPIPRLELREVLRRHASAAADVSDGLLADAGHLGEASRLAVELELDRLPLSAEARVWLSHEDAWDAALEALASSGDDYEIVCTTSPAQVQDMIADASRVGVTLTPIGRLASGSGLTVSLGTRQISVKRRGWTHR